MEWWLILLVLLPLLVPVLAGAVSKNAQVSRFTSLGDIAGRRMSEIIAIVGPPSSVSPSEEGKLYQWLAVNSAGHTHYAILADRQDRAIGFSHQSVG